MEMVKMVVQVGVVEQTLAAIQQVEQVLKVQTVVVAFTTHLETIMQAAVVDI
jgi:hypothetical protein